MALAPFVILLRAVNVGGAKLMMADLRAFAADLGLKNPRTLLQSGNLVAESGLDEAALASLFEAEAEKRLGLSTTFLVRGRADWKAIVAANPYPDEAVRDPSRLVAIPLTGTPDAEAIAALKAAIVGRETTQVIGRELYAYYPDGQGESKLTIGVIERKLGVRGTARNWNTTTKLAAMLEA